MANLVALDFNTHGALKHGENQRQAYASGAHMLSIRVTEVPQAIIDFPVLISRMSNGDMGLSTLTSFEPGGNLFLVNDAWTSSFQPSAMRTFPFYLMRPANDSSDPVLGVVEDSPALSREKGQPLFDKKGKLSLYLQQLKAQLFEDSKNTVHTFQFFEKLIEFDLIRSVDLILNYADGQTSRITGLSTIHEDNLQGLSSNKFTELRDIGYLPPIYAMLFSVFQFNALIRLHNKQSGVRIIKNINLEVNHGSRPA